LADLQKTGIGQGQAQEDLLKYLATGGRAALQELAQANGLTEAELLQKVFLQGAPGLTAQAFRRN